MVATIIQAPQPIPARHGLIDSAFPSPELAAGSNRWENGFGFRPEHCSEPESWVIPCVGQVAGGPGAANTENRPLNAGEFLSWAPYQIRASFKCDAQQLHAIDFEQRARRIFELGESKLMETELYRGDAAGYAAFVADPINHPTFNPSLTRSDPLTAVTDLSGGAGATTPTLAIRFLVQAAAGAPGGTRAMIHCTPAVAMAWMQGGSIKEDRDGKLVTCIGGHYVIVGAGYTGQGPDNVTPLPTDNIHWAWVTSPVYWLRAGEVEVLRAVDQRNNDAEVIVQRTAAAYWDTCLHSGVPVSTVGAV